MDDGFNKATLHRLEYVLLEHSRAVRFLPGRVHWGRVFHKESCDMARLFVANGEVPI